MSDVDTEIHNAYEVIKDGRIILYPTDTVCQIGRDATNEEAVAKRRLSELKCLCVIGQLILS